MLKALMSCIEADAHPCKALRERFQALQKEVEDEKRERKFLNTEKEQLQMELTRVQQEAEANLKAAQTAAIPAAPAAPAAPIAPSSPSVQRRDSEDGESEDVGGLLAAITKGVSLQPVVRGMRMDIAVMRKILIPPHLHMCVSRRSTIPRSRDRRRKERSKASRRPSRWPSLDVVR